MADSPLSITASVTGILTFVAAILAFIYVRYNIIRNGNIEMITIFKSVAGFIVETITIAETTGSGDHVRSGSLQELITEQLRTEIGVIKKCMVALGVDPAQIPSDPYSFVSYDKLLQRHRNIIGLYRSALEAYSKSSNGWRICMHRLDGCIQINRPGLVLFWAVTLYLSSFGVSPMQLRWYRVRDSVLEMIQRRETLRSQLLFHQISLMNLQAKSHEALTHQLIDENRQLRSLVEEVVKANTEIKSIMLKTTHLNQPDLQPEVAHETVEDN